MIEIVNVRQRITDWKGNNYVPRRDMTGFW